MLLALAKAPVLLSLEFLPLCGLLCGWVSSDALPTENWGWEEGQKARSSGFCYWHKVRSQFVNQEPLAAYNHTQDRRANFQFTDSCLILLQFLTTAPLNICRANCGGSHLQFQHPRGTNWQANARWRPDGLYVKTMLKKSKPNKQTNKQKGLIRSRVNSPKSSLVYLFPHSRHL